MADYLERSVAVERVDGVWRMHAKSLANQPFDVWISLTNEDGAWAEVPFQLPNSVVLHGTTTSGWGFSAGRHIPHVEDCTLCRNAQAGSESSDALRDRRNRCGRGGGSAGVAAVPIDGVRRAGPCEFLQLKPERRRFVTERRGRGPERGVAPAVIAVRRRPTVGCRGCGNCRALWTDAWYGRGGRGRFAGLSAGSTAP